jgi:protein ImuB
MRQLDPAESITVRVQDERPQTIFFRGKRYAVDHAYGPWLASGDWWNGTHWRLEQWDIIARSEGNMLCCKMLRDLRHGSWLMAGLYD